MKTPILESKLWQAITAVASGVITDLLYDLLSPSSYTIQDVDSQYVLIPNSNNATWFSICVILMLFFSLWGIIILIIQISTKLSKHLGGKRKPHLCGYKLVTQYTKAKEETIKLNSIFDSEMSHTPNITYIKLYLRDLSIPITSLHAQFYPHTRHQKTNLKYFFRNPEHSTILSINNIISKYEFLALIALLQKMVLLASSHVHKDKLMEKDCKDLLTMLQELDTTVNAIE